MTKIIAIDDNQNNLIVLSSLLKNLMPDCNVITATSGAEGIIKTKSHQPDTIIIDIKMPEMDGFEVCKRLKSDEKTSHIPIILLTAVKTDPKYRIKGLEIGADAFLSKPIDEGELIAQINVMLRIKKAEDDLRREKKYLDFLVNKRTQVLGQRTRELKERIKEINCLYYISQLLENADRLSEDLFQQVVDRIPSGWRYPQMTCALLSIDNKNYLTINGDPKFRSHYGDIIVNNQKVGMLEIYMAEQPPTNYNMNLQKDEKTLFDAILRRIGSFIEHQQSRELARISEANLEEAQRIAHLGSWEYDIQRDKLYWSDEVYRICGVTKESFKPSISKFKQMIHPEDLAMFESAYSQARQGVPQDIKHRIILDDKSERIVHIRAEIHLNKEYLPKIIATMQDVTEQIKIAKQLKGYKEHLEERIKESTSELLFTNNKLQQEIIEKKRAEEELKTSLKEKELLLREIHHRVKNNLQVISSMLALQARSVDDHDMNKILQESMDRVKSIALVHQKLYQSKNFANIDIHDYINELADSLFKSYQINTYKKKISLNTIVDDIDIGIDIAVPCALIINELVSNSLKYAFPHEKSGSVTITFKMIDDIYVELTVKDDGIGIPKEIDIKNTDSLGLKIIVGLAEHQLNGKIDINLKNGTEFKITFKKNRYDP